MKISDLEHLKTIPKSINADQSSQISGGDALAIASVQSLGKLVSLAMTQTVVKSVRFEKWPVHLFQ